MRVCVGAVGCRSLVLVALALGLISVEQLRRPGSPVALGRSPTAARARALGELPLAFEPNAGQVAAAAKFIARQSAADVFLTEDGLLVALKGAPEPSRAPSLPGGRGVVRLRWIGGSAKDIAGVSELAGRTNYLRGSDPASWRTDIPTYGKVRYSSLYPGIDLVYYGNQQQLEYDFIVAPGADADRIRLALDGASRVEIGRDGELVLQIGDLTLTQPPPRVYQELGGGRREISGRYLLVSEREVVFRLGPYDRTKSVVIDPVLDFSTYVGGTRYDYVHGIALDAEGNVYLVGQTGSSDFAVTAGAFQTSYGGGSADAFVVKLSPDGSTALYSTYLGGSGEDVAYSVGVDRFGQACLTGYTRSTNFPTANARQAYLRGGPEDYDAFVAKLNASGNGLVYSTYLGGSDADSGRAIAVDGDGNAYIAGITNSRDFPVTDNAYQPNFGGPLSDAFVARLNADGSEYFYVTYFGGRLYDAAFGVATDGDGNAYVVGTTGSPDFPTRNPIFPAIGGGGGEYGDADAFVAKLNWDGSLIYSTFLGGRLVDAARAVAVDSWGNAYVTGDTVSPDFPTVNPLQPQLAGSVDAFVAKINVEGTALVYSTYLGGARMEQGYGIAVDREGAATVAGSTSSTDFPVAAEIQDHNRGSDDVFVSRLDPAGSALTFSTYLGGVGQDIGFAIALDCGGNAVIAGSTSSYDFPTRHSVQGDLLGWANGFAAKLTAGSP